MLHYFQSSATVCMFLIPYISQPSIRETTNTLKETKLMTSIKLLHVSIRGGGPSSESVLEQRNGSLTC